MSRMHHRRQRQILVFTGLVIVAAVVNVLFYFILYRPIQSEYFNLQDSIIRLRAETGARQVRMAQRMRTSAQLDSSGQARTTLYADHFIPADVGFAQVLPEIDNMAQKTGVRKTRVDYGRESIPQYGLYSVTIRIPVQGTYPGIVNFIKELEESQTFYIINSIEVKGAESTAQVVSGTIALSLGLETYFYQ